MVAICSSKGSSSTLAARKFGIEYASSDYRGLLADPGCASRWIVHSIEVRLVLGGNQFQVVSVIVGNYILHAHGRERCRRKS